MHILYLRPTLSHAAYISHYLYYYFFQPRKFKKKVSNILEIIASKLIRNVMTENVVGNFYLNWTFLTFYFITLDLRKRYSEHRDNNQNIFEIIKQLMIIQTLK